MTSPFQKRHLKTERSVHEQSASPLGHRFAKLKVERGLLAIANRPVLGEAIARRTAGRPWSKSKAPSK